MKFDNYCIALVVLVLFFLYLDNSVNVEGYAPLSGSEVDKVDTPVQEKVTPPTQPPPTQPVEVKTDGVKAPASKQNLETIGAKPQKLQPMNTPPSMDSGLTAVSSNGGKLSSLDSAFAPLIDPQLIPNQVPADLASLGSRVGGLGNVGDKQLGGMGGPVPSGSATGGNGPMPYADMGDMMGSPLMVQPSAPSTQPSAVSAPAAPTKAPAKKKKLEVHMVYTDWCGHSKRALPHFDKVQQEYNGKDMGTHIVEVYKHDAETPEGKKVAKDNNVRGFPTHFMVVEGEKIEKGIGRTYDELVGKIHELTGN